MRALSSVGADVRLSSDPREALSADALVVPGVGAFAACMASLTSIGADDTIRQAVAAQMPILAICVGHQILFSHGVEQGIEAEGVGIFPGVIEKLPTTRLPHMGWNDVAPDPDSRFFHQRHRYYFVHSYAALTVTDIPVDARGIWAEHDGTRFLAAVEHGSVLSTQFHPEKSGQAGLSLLRRWVDTLGES
ncbi:MAG: imidazole glycerol phosphate synthase subunit HisH [Propionibacteriaceae bacterium]|nr:imidazole glycerol phosphate synthase subunit HisH [Propionibacteriaceae bacterium]